MARITLDPEQEQAVVRMVNEPTRAALNASQYGTGKTVTTVEVAQRVGAKVVLIVAPLFTKYSWEDTIKRQYPQSEVLFINSSKSGTEALLRLLDGVAGWYIIGREYFATKKVSGQLAPKSHIIDFLAYDECQRFANHRSAGYRLMKRIKPKYKMALSATPAANKFSGLFAITQWLWPKLEGHASYWQWVEDWCDTEMDFFAGKVVRGPKPDTSFVDTLPCYIRLTKDFGEPTEVRVNVKLSRAERKIYDTFVEHMIVWLNDNPLIVTVPVVKRMRLREMTLGEVQVDDTGNVVDYPDTMKSTKLETLVEIMEEYPSEPMLILTHSAKYARVVTLQLQQRGFRAMEWTGNITEKKRQAIKVLFEADEGIDYIVATPGSIGEGTDGLQHRARFMVWLSRDDNNMLNEQAFRRLFRRGQTKEVISIDIEADDTYDSGQLDSLAQQAINMNRALRKEQE